MTADNDIVILGAGLGGIGMGCVLQQNDVKNFRILEKSDAVGGTWRENRYPGAACDTESHLYCYSFNLHTSVSRTFAQQPELLAYAERLVRDGDLAPHIGYDSEIIAATWSGQRWTITLRSGDTITARVFIAAWGQLNRPQIPEIAGRESFAGQQFHSAEWPAAIDFAGKRVASIGNAASAVQYVPELAKQASHLAVFQRSPNWIVPRGDRLYTADELASYAHDPELFRESKNALFAWRETTFQRMREGSDDAREVEEQARSHLAWQVPDAALAARLLPDFPLGCKRVLRSDDYYPALMRDNVSLVTDGIDRIVPDGIVTRDGTLRPLDVIVWGTGFETQSFQGPVDVYGLDGASLRDAWEDGARAYKGMTVPGFPNFFLIYGPNTNLGHNGVLTMFEAQFGYIAQAVQQVLDEGVALDVRDDVARAYDDALQAEMAGSAWAGDCTSWYKNADGRVVNNWSGLVETYIDQTRVFDRAAYRAIA